MKYSAHRNKLQKEFSNRDKSLVSLQNKIKSNTDKLEKDAAVLSSTELNKLKMMSPMSAEATVVRNYIDWMTNVPWKKRSKVKRDLNKAQEVLDADHFGLDKVKERIIEYLAVQQRMSKLKGPILCLVGPPGVGKSHGVEKVLGKHDLIATLGERAPKYEVVKGAMSAIGLYCKLFKYADKDNVIVFDDCDSVLQDELSLNILKAALDSKKTRRIHWNTDSFKLILPNTEELAEQMSLSALTLYRRLQQEGTSYQIIKERMNFFLMRNASIEIKIQLTLQYK